MKKLPALCVVTDGNFYKLVQSAIEPLVPSIFTRLTVGNAPADFQGEKSKSDDLVVVLAGAGANSVLRELCVGGDRVKWIHSLWAGVDAYNLASLRDVIRAPVSNARGNFSTILGEHVMLSCLYFNREIPRLQNNRKARQWDRFPISELRGQRMGIVGYGDIGRATAKLATAFGMKVTGLKRSLPTSAVDDLGVSLVAGKEAEETLLRESDAVVMILPATPETKNYMTGEKLGMMKPSAVLVNIGRGVTLNEDDLVAALRARKIRGAALDVAQVEPLPSNSPLWQVGDDQLLLTPHNADVTKTCFYESGVQFAEYAQAFVTNGKLPPYLIDIEKGY